MDLQEWSYFNWYQCFCNAGKLLITVYEINFQCSCGKKVCIPKKQIAFPGMLDESRYVKSCLICSTSNVVICSMTVSCVCFSFIWEVFRIRGKFSVLLTSWIMAVKVRGYVAYVFYFF
jgi:hypothetical protein